MPKQQRLTAEEAEKLILKAGFNLIRSKGSHRIYIKNKVRIILPFHTNKILHPKIVKQVIKAMEE